MDPYQDLSKLDPDDSGDSLSYPKDHEGWLRRYEELDAAYQGDPYTVAQIKTLGLFRALDTDGKILAQTRRLTRDVQHVVDTDARAITGGDLVLETDEDAPDDAQVVGEAVWRRSDVAGQKGKWGVRMCALGDLHLEAVLGEDGKARIVHYDPRSVVLTYDTETGTRIQQADIRLQYFDPAVVDPNGMISAVNVASHVYVRTITPERIDVWVDGEHDTRASGRNPLGVVSLVHVPCLPWREPEHGLWAAPGLEPCLALIDSLMTQVLAIGTRHANPLLMLKGFKLAAGTDVLKHGMVLSGVPKDGDAGYIEIQGNIVRLLEAVEQERVQVRATLPEFLFSESGATESGEARSYRAAAFEMKIRDMRGRLYSALTRLTQYAYHLERVEAYNEDVGMYQIDAPPILPRNVMTETGVLADAWDRKLVRKADIVRAYQRLGIIPADMDPDEYVTMLDEGLGSQAAQFLTPPGGQPVTQDAAPLTPEEEAALAGAPLDLTR